MRSTLLLLALLAVAVFVSGCSILEECPDQDSPYDEQYAQGMKTPGGAVLHDAEYAPQYAHHEDGCPPDDPYDERY